MDAKISENLKILTAKLDKSLKSLNADELEDANLPLSQLREDIRETVQENLSGPAKVLIKKLKKDQDITTEDIRIIEKWVIGDADYYTRIENNLIDWVAECKRLQNVLGHYTSENVKEDETKLLALGALLTDLKFTLDDVIRYAEARDRVKMFQSSIGAGRIDKERKKWLAEMIEQQLYSGEF